MDSKEPAIHLQSTFIMDYNCIFQACHFEKNHNVYPHNVMFPFGIGSSGTDQKLFQKEENQKHIVYRLNVVLGILEHADS
ncbi:MAG: hypothetical protein QN732_10135 [Nitrososphaeraceae archaeon]|nr:hypothetical protein [Nitrososphaeraceae archaeon]